MPSGKRELAQLRIVEKKLDLVIRRQARVENLLSDATQKLCHLIKRKREIGEFEDE